MTASALAARVVRRVAAVAFLFFFQAEDGIRDADVTGVQTCALPIYRTRAVAGWRPDACGQRPHRARQGALRRTARSTRRDGRCGAPGRLLADDRGDRQLTTIAMSLTPSLPSSFQLASDEVHTWCTSLGVPPEASARLY